jgi:AMMECR1 domain-containing protein
MVSLVVRWRDALRARTADDPAEACVLSWLRTIVLEDDVFLLDTPRWPRGTYRFATPSLPSSRPEPVPDPLAGSRARFIVRARGHADRDPGWRSILSLRTLVVMERDAPHGRERPLRLGLDAEEGLRMLRRARHAAERFLADGERDFRSIRAGDPPRLAQRSQVAVALWTRGRLRGSIITSSGPALRAVGQAAVSACQDDRFPRVSASDLAESVFQIGLLHAPRVPLSGLEIEAHRAYPDKALFVSDGPRSGAYLPEVFNVLPRRTAHLRSLADSLALEKVGLARIGPATRFEVCEVTEAVESADRSRALRLDGPVARWEGDAETSKLRDRAMDAGKAACGWLAAIQAEDGSLPLFVRPSTGEGQGVDFVRSAMTAEALAAFGAACRHPPAVECAQRLLAWLDRARPGWTRDRGLALPATVYRGKAALLLGDEAAVRAAAKSALDLLDGPDPGPLVLAQAASFLDRASGSHPAAAHRCSALRSALAERFERAIASGEEVSLAEWAELGAAFPASSRTATLVCEWLRSRQLPSGAFPESTTSDLVYSRGTGKVFEVLALRPDESPDALGRCLVWLLSMQYREDSAFFVPHENWPRVLGGFRHDPHGTDAWIDAAGHFLLGLVRLATR